MMSFTLVGFDPPSLTDELAARAVEVMERFSITTLVVSEDGRTVLGILHLHDLLKSGVV